MKQLQAYQQRVVEEKQALDEKRQALTVFLNAKALPVSEDELDLLLNQFSHMTHYGWILGERIELF